MSLPRQWCRSSHCAATRRHPIRHEVRGTYRSHRQGSLIPHRGQSVKCCQSIAYAAVMTAYSKLTRQPNNMMLAHRSGPEAERAASRFFQARSASDCLRARLAMSAFAASSIDFTLQVLAVGLLLPENRLKGRDSRPPSGEPKPDGRRKNGEPIGTAGPLLAR